MPDNLNIRRPHDNKRINIHQAWEVEWWCTKLNCTRYELIDAVKHVGDSVEAVKQYLKNIK